MTAFATAESLLPGFSDPVLDAQRVFRSVLEAVARPGTIVDMPLHLAAPAPLDSATAAVALALADYETPVWLDGAADTEPVRQYLRFHCGSPLTAAPNEAAFAIIAAPALMPALDRFNQGSDEYPDRSTTLIIQVPTLSHDEALTLRGPGIRDSVRLSAGGFPHGFARWVADNNELFPRGVDLIFTCGTLIAGLPRSTRLDG